MATTPHSSAAGPDIKERILTRPRLISIIIFSVLLILCLVFAWVTRDAMRSLPRLRGKLRTGTSLVDQSPWQTAQALTPLAVSTEEIRYAREAERLADHAVDQAFAAALREATLRAQNTTLTGPALALAQKVTQLEQAVAQDQTLVKQLAAAQSTAGAAAGQNPQGGQQSGQSSSGSDLDIAKAQLSLDSDELTDARQDVARASGDVRPQIEDELGARNAAMKKYDAEDHATGETAVMNAAKYATLAGRVGAWFKQSSRLMLIEQAADEARAAATNLAKTQSTLATQAGSQANAAASNGTTRLARIQAASLRQQLVSIYEDRIRTEQQLASVYDKWAAQVGVQHQILLHLVLQSLAWIFVILICMVLSDGLVRRVMEYPRLDRRQKQTLRSILELGIQLVGVVCILLVIFGAPQQTTEMLGLVTAAITIALQDFVLAFFGWFVLMGKKGMRVGDTVEINGVGGEVIEIGLMSTTLLESGALAGKGYPTGRRISFMNSFAIRGTYFNFSTSGQWLWDELDVTVPAGADSRAVMEKVQSAVEEETRSDASAAETEWLRTVRGAALSRRGAAPAVHLLSSGTLEVRYVTRASERVETRERLHERVMEVLRDLPVAAS